MLAKLVSKWVMPVGSFTAWNTVSNQTVKCHLTRPLVVVMTHSTPFSLKLVLVNTFHVPSLLIWNQLLLMKSVLVLIVNSFGGGTGSGFTSLLMERLSVDYGKK